MMFGTWLSWGGYWWDEAPPGKKYFLADLMDGHYLEHLFIVLPVRKAIFMS